MGWTYKMDKPENIQEWVKNELLVWSNTKFIHTVLDVKIVNFKEVYAAVEVIDSETGDRNVFAALVMLDYKPHEQYEFGYKTLDETCMPYLFNCPKSILDKLTPTDNEHSNTWRGHCHEILKQRVPCFGQTIELSEAIVFTDGVKRSKFEVVRWGYTQRQKRYRCIETMATVSISNIKSRNYTVMDKPGNIKEWVNN